LRKAASAAGKGGLTPLSNIAEADDQRPQRTVAQKSLIPQRFAVAID
jgi:hypothetical protein